MNKKEFLKALEKKLKVLTEEERQDILNEHDDIIKEKMRHGKLEEEAVSEFGDIDKLSEEILKSYKINPDYNKNNIMDKVKEGLDKGIEHVQKEVDGIVKAKENKKEEEKEKDKKRNDDMIMLILKICAVILVVVPLCSIAFGVLFAAVFTIYFLLKGVPMYAASICIWSIFAILVYIICFILKLLFTKKKPHIWPFPIMILVTIISFIFTIDYMMSFKYVGKEELLKDDYLIRTDISFDKELHISYDEVEVNNDLEDNQAIVDVYYFEDMNDLKIDDYEEGGINYFSIDVQIKNKSVNDIIDTYVLKNLKEKKIYDPLIYPYPYVKVYVNEKTEEKIR